MHKIAASFLMLAFAATWTRDWSGEVAPVEVVREVVSPIENVQHVPFLSVQWSSDLLDIEQPVEDQPDPLVMLMESTPECVHCPQEWARVTMSRDFISKGWLVGDGGHFRKLDVPFDKVLPQWVLMRGDKEVRRFPAGISVYELTSAYRDEHEATLVKSYGPQKTINAGVVSREQLEMALRFIGKSGSYQGSNDPQSFPANGITVAIPKNMGAKWSTGEDGVLRADFSPRPSGRWGIVAIPVSGLSYDGKQVVILTPFSAINPVLKVE